MKVLRTLLSVALLATASPAFAVDTKPTRGAPDLSAVRARIKAADYRTAITELNRMVDRGVQHADVYNLLGFSYRKSGDTRRAMTFYQKALEFDPNHKGALEYSGELYVQLGDVARARRNEAKLRTLCPRGCEELTDLQQAINRVATRTQ
jgi:Flp pilus assembly protein TadD